MPQYLSRCRTNLPAGSKSYCRRLVSLRPRGRTSERWLRGGRVVVEDAHLGCLVLSCRQHPDFLETEMLAHFVAEVLGFHASARRRREPNVRRELCHETPKDMKGSKAAGAFKQSCCPVGTEQTHCLSRPVYGHQRRECPHHHEGDTHRKPIGLPPTGR